MSDDIAAWLRSQVDDDETLAESDYDIMISARKARDAATEIARLRAALATARREGMEEAAQIGDRHVEIGEVLSETEADKRLADNIKMQVGAMKQVVGAIRAAAKEGK